MNASDESLLLVGLQATNKEILILIIPTQWLVVCFFISFHHILEQFPCFSVFVNGTLGNFCFVTGVNFK